MIRTELTAGLVRLLLGAVLTTASAQAETCFWCGGRFADYGDAANWTNSTGRAISPPGAEDDLYGLESRYLDLGGRSWSVNGWDSTGNWSRYTTSISNGTLDVVGRISTHSDTIDILSGGSLHVSGVYSMAYNDAGAHCVNVKDGGSLWLDGELKVYKLELSVAAGGVLRLSPRVFSIYDNTAQASSIVNLGSVEVDSGFVLSGGSSRAGASLKFVHAGGVLTLRSSIGDGGVAGANSFVWEGGEIRVVDTARIDFADSRIASGADLRLTVGKGKTFDFGRTVFGAGSRVTVTGGGRLRPPANRPSVLTIEDGELFVDGPGVYDLTGIVLGAGGALGIGYGLTAERDGDVLTVRSLPVGSIAVARTCVAFEDGRRELRNPACGHAGGFWTTLKNDGTVIAENLSGNCSKLWCLSKFSKGYVYDGDLENYRSHVEGFVGGADIELDEGALLSISNTLLSVRRNGGSVVTRIAYTWDGYGGCECDDFETVLAHIRQVAGVYNCFTDVIAAVECGVIGAYGEMHTSRYTGSAYANRIIDTWLSAMDASIPLLLRSPGYLLGYAGGTAEDVSGDPASLSAELRAVLDRLGFYNDGYLGTFWDYGTWSDRTMSRDQGRAYLASRPHLPYGGEFATVTEEYFDGESGRAYQLFDPRRHNLVKEWYDTHLNYLRAIESAGMTVFRKMAERTFRIEDYRFEGMPDLHEYDGTDLRTFCRDHMGARFVIRDARLESEGRLKLEIENTGFSSVRFPLFAQVIFTDVNAGDGSALVVPARVSEDYPVPGGRKSLVFAFGRPDGLYLSGDWRLGIRLFASLADESSCPARPRRPFVFANDSSDGVRDDGSLTLFALRLREAGADGGTVMSVY